MRLYVKLQLVAAPRNTLPDLLSLDVEALRALAIEQQTELLSRDIEIDNLKLLVLKLKRMQFGRKSEKVDRQIAQLELCLEELEAAPVTTPVPTVPASSEAVANKPARRSLPESLPRVTRTHAPKQETCPDCGGKLRPLGEDVSEMLEVCAGALRSYSVSTSEAELRSLRAHRTSAGAEPPH